MKKHYETHVEDTDKLISVAGPELDYKSWYEQYRKLMEEQAQRKYGLYTPTSEGKVYDENWNEYNIVPGNISSNYTMVNLGFDGSNQFAESATKLAGIYSSALSKDDCIKAYNYLQTLKSK